MRNLSILLLVALFPSFALQAQEKPDYFPLQIGNSWTYIRREYEHLIGLKSIDTVTVSITELKEIHGKEYYFFSNGEAYRKGEDGDIWRYFYGPRDSMEVLMFNFSSAPGEEYEYEYDMVIWGYKTLIFRNEPCTHTTEGGDFQNSIPFVLIPELVEGSSSGAVMAPGVGRIYFWVTGSFPGDEVNFSLLRATVNGVNYGQIVFVEKETWGRVKLLFKRLLDK